MAKKEGEAKVRIKDEARTKAVGLGMRTNRDNPEIFCNEHYWML